MNIQPYPNTSDKLYTVNCIGHIFGLREGYNICTDIPYWPETCPDIR